MYQIADQLVQTGKCQKEDILFLNFENPQLVELQAKDMLSVVEVYYELYGKKPKYLFFDEVQSLPKWGTVLRYFHDQHYEIIVSGSSSKLLLEEISTELRGRYSHRLMLPFSFPELLTYHKLDWKKLEYSTAF
jgi:predicted AAA+ superfamily ATPase